MTQPDGAWPVCPGCGTPAAAGQRYCDSCGTAVACPNGHELTEAGITFCPVCATALYDAAPATVGGRFAWLPLAAGLGAMVVIGAVVVAVLALTGGDDDDAAPAASTSVS